MYEVYIINDGITKLLHSDNVISEKQGLKIIDGKIVEGINTINSFSFSMLPNNPRFNELFSYTTKIYVIKIKDNRRVFYGRVVKPKVSMESDGSFSKTIECEDRMGYLCDSLMDYLPEQYWNVKNTTYHEDGSIDKRGVLEFVLSIHNKKQPDEKKIYVGEVDIEDTDNVLYFGMQQHKNAFDTLKEKLIEHLGGELRLREGTDGKLYLDYLKEAGEVKTTSIALKKNMQKLSKETDPTSFITRLYPLGNKIKKTVEEKDGSITEIETDERITCAEANDGIPYVDDEEGIRTYGIIEGYRIYDHVVYPRTLLNHARVTLATNNKVKQKHVITALDLSTIGLDIDSFEVGNYHPIKNSLVGVDDTLRIIKKTTNINQPETSQLEIGDKYATLTELQLKRENSLKAEVNRTIETVSNNAQYNVAKTSNYLTSLINQFTDRIEQIIREETVSVSDFETYKTSISTEFDQTKDSFDFIFKNIQQEIKDVNGVVSTNQNKMVKYIRFEDGNIILGLVGNEVLLKESNDRISFLQNNIEVAYFSNNKLFVTNAEFTNGLKIFELEFTRESNGSYTFG
uniref:Tail protein n=1 Tax=Siphoviridae sp. ctUse40 TaxID=2826356 RepID=A0A8S5NCY5_9CAUD|nr:MAG TPA: tail protein [Siphoviridae sp. ctUse40]